MNLSLEFNKFRIAIKIPVKDAYNGIERLLVEEIIIWKMRSKKFE